MESQMFEDRVLQLSDIADAAQNVSRPILPHMPLAESDLHTLLHRDLICTLPVL
jgi:hypothetical protein